MDRPNGAGHLDVEKSQPNQNQSSKIKRRGRFRTLIFNFAPVWFTICMNAGIIGILTHQSPWQFPGLQIISTIAYLIDLILWLIFSTLFITRLVLYPHTTFHSITSSAESLSLLAAWPISYLTIVSFIALTISTASWGGYSWTLLAYSLWWIGAFWIIAFALFILIILIRRAELDTQPISPLIMLPVVGVATLSTIGGLISSNSYAITPGLAVPVIITSCCTIGLGLFMALPLYALLLKQFFTSGFPAPAAGPGMFVLVGPMGQLAAALQLHGSAASVYGQFGGYSKGQFLTANSAETLNVVCVLLALMMVGMGTLWMLISLYYMLELAWTRKLGWTMSWNAIVFPLGTLGAALLELAIELDSVFFRVVTSIDIVVLVVLWLVNGGFIVGGIVRGEVLVMKEEEGEVDKEK